ncbi:hypothetical protein CVT25_007633, partial [Psilocybe cyanescens]
MPHSPIEAMSESDQTQARKHRLEEIAAWKTRNGNIDTDWADVLDKGIMWDSTSYGGQSRGEFRDENRSILEVYMEMKKKILSFEEDMEFFTSSADRLDNLAKAMNNATGAARSNDISSLKRAVLGYTAACMPNQRLDPPIPNNDLKSGRGFAHIQLARLLCPVKNHDAFDDDPEGYRRKMASGSAKVSWRDLPNFCWDEYDPEHIISGMFKSNILVKTFKHIFTSPSSAMKEPGLTHTKSSQAKRNKMKSVTPPSIAYTCVQYRFAISESLDWRQDDRLFKTDKFFYAVLETIDIAK